MGIFDFISSNFDKQNNTAYMENLANEILVQALKMQIVNGANIYDNNNVYVWGARELLGKKAQRASNDLQYLESLGQNITFYANASYFYTDYLKKIIPNNIPNRSSAEMEIDIYQAEARNLVAKEKVLYDYNSCVVSTSTLEKSMSIPFPQRFYEAESIYAQLWVGNDVLLDTIGIIISMKSTFSSHAKEIDGKKFMDIYMNKLINFIGNCVSRYPVIINRS